MQPNAFAILILLAWPALMLLLGLVLPVRRVVMVSLLGGNLFLPATAIALPGFPNYSKLVSAGLGALVVGLVFGSRELFRVRPRLFDLFFLGFLASPGISSLLNELGPYDASSSVANRILEWGAAYWVGRAFFTTLPALRDLCMGIILSALAYAPLCIYEIRMSPQLSSMIYGFRPSAFVMTWRFGGYRPQVFMQHGLALAVWMATASLVTWVVWRSRAIASVWGVPISWVAIGLLILTVWLRSSGAAILLLGLIASFELFQATRLKLLITLIVICPISYISLRTAGWEGQQMVQMAEHLEAERARSLGGRLHNDELIADRVMSNRPVFGWGGWGHWRVKDEKGNDITVSDSWWTILLGTTGVFGLFCTYAVFMSPLFPLLHRLKRRMRLAGPLGAAWAIGLGVLLFVIDTLANAMPNSSFMLMSAALVSIYPLVSPKAMEQRKRAQQAMQNRTETPEPAPSEPEAGHASPA